MVKFKKNAIKAWSTWGIGALTGLAFFHEEVTPMLQPLMNPDHYMTMLGVVGAGVTVLRFIDQQLDG